MTLIASLALSACAQHESIPWDDPYATDHLPHLNPGQQRLGEQLPPPREPRMWEDYYNTTRPGPVQPSDPSPAK
jgi:hypothetical protein